LHPPSRPSPDSRTESRKTRGARRHLMACPPEALWAAGCRGSNQTQFTPPKWRPRTKIRSSPVYAGHAIKPLKNLRSSRAPAVSDRIEVVSLSRRPCPIPLRRRILFLSSDPYGRPERNNLPLFQHFGMRARTCQQRPARPEAAIYPLRPCLPRAKIGPLRMGRKSPKSGVQQPSYNEFRAKWGRYGGIAMAGPGWRPPYLRRQDRCSCRRLSRADNGSPSQHASTGLVEFESFGQPILKHARARRRASVAH
jgi:hypothetical protein